MLAVCCRSDAGPSTFSERNMAQTLPFRKGIWLRESRTTGIREVDLKGCARHLVSYSTLHSELRKIRAWQRWCNSLHIIICLTINNLSGRNGRNGQLISRHLGQLGFGLIQPGVDDPEVLLAVV